MDLILVVTKPFDWCVERKGQTLSRHSSQEAAYKAALDYASALFEEGIRTQVTIKPRVRSFAGSFAGVGGVLSLTTACRIHVFTLWGVAPNLRGQYPAGRTAEAYVHTRAK